MTTFRHIGKSGLAVIVVFLVATLSSCCNCDEEIAAKNEALTKLKALEKENAELTKIRKLLEKEEARKQEAEEIHRRLTRIDAKETARQKKAAEAFRKAHPSPLLP